MWAPWPRAGERSGLVARSNNSSVAILAAFTLLGSGCAFITQIIAARALGPGEFGVFSSALATVTAVAPFIGFGVQSFWLRVFGEEGWQARRWLSASLTFSLWTAVLSVGLLSLGGFAVRARMGGGGSLILLQVHMLSMAYLEIVGTKFLLEERPLALMLWQTVPQVLRLSIVAFLSLNAGELNALSISAAFAAVGLGTLVMGLRNLVLVARGDIALVGHGARVAEINDGPGADPGLIAAIRGAWPYGLGSIFYQFYFQAGIVSLTYLASPVDAGKYGAAASILAAVYMVPNVVYQKLILPRLHRWASHSRERFVDAHVRGFRIMLALGCAVAVGVGVISPWGIPFVFGDDYKLAGLILLVLSIAIPFRFISISVGASLSLDRFVRVKVAAMFFVALLCIGLNILTISSLGVWGAVAATIAGECALALLYLRIARAVTPKVKLNARAAS